MVSTLIRHKWKAFWRSPALTQQLASTLMMGFLFLYFAAIMIGAGAGASFIIEKALPEADVISLFGGLTLYALVFMLLMRIVLQKFPVSEIKQYQSHNVKKKNIVQFINMGSLMSSWNFFLGLMVVPFMIVNYTGLSERGILWSFLIMFIGWTIFNNFLAFILDRFFKKENLIPYIIMGALVILLFLDFNGYISLIPFFQTAFQWITQNIFFSLIPLVAGITAWFYNSQSLKNNFYLEDLVTEAGTDVVSNLNLPFLERFGKAGKLMNLELKLIWRNKRSRMGVIMSILMLAYPMIFIGSPSMDNGGFKLFLGLFITGFFALNYGQLMLSWNSEHFDLLATRNVKIKDIFLAKYYIMIFSCILLYLFSLGYYFLDPDFVRINTVMFLFNVGVSIFLYMLLAAFNSKRIDLSKGAMMNYEGIGIAHFLIMIPLIALPILIRLPFALSGHPMMGEWMIGLVGLIGAVFHTPIINFCTELFQKRRYKILAAFRKKT